MRCIPTPAPAPILTPARLAGWRAGLARSHEPLALVTGSFALWHPGNLAAIRAAARHGRPVCVAVSARVPFAAPSLADRCRMLAGLRGVAAVLPCPERGAAARLARLRPFILFDCPARPGASALASAARALADRIEALPPIHGCFTDEIRAAIRGGRTPLAIPAGVLPPLPSEDDGRRDLSSGDAARPLVTVNGCFDLLHPGHVRLLQRARALGARLAVLVNDDASVRAYKGAGRPIFPLRCRLAALRAIEAVSVARPFAGDTPLPLLAQLRPEIHVKGGSFEAGRVRAERELLRGWGGRVAVVPMIGAYSTTRLLEAAR